MKQRFLNLAMLAISLGVFSGGASLAEAGGGPENVFLVVNSESVNSMTVANHYIALREIPANNVYYLSWKPIYSSTKPEKFRDHLLKPILEEIDSRRLGGQIDQIVYSTGFPFSIDYRTHFKDQEIPTDQRRLVSLTGGTYLYQFTMSDRKELVGLNSNFYANVPKDGISSSQAFHGQQRWQPGGKTGEKHGVRYLLSTSLGITFGDGSTIEEIVAYLKRARTADGTKPKGTIYYTTSGDIRTRVRAKTFDAAVAELKTLGVQAMVVKGNLPKGKHDVAGLTIGTPKPDFLASNIKLQPGALVDNLTSFGAAYHLPAKKRGQTLLNEFLKWGAAGASGTVTEPTANTYKFPLATLHVHYARGCSMAESFYQSIQGAFQILIVGDPLCQPWATQAEISVAEGAIASSGAVAGKVRLKPEYRYQKADDAKRIKRFEMFVDGVRTQACQPGQEMPWDTTQLDDGYHHLAIVGIEDSAIQVQSRYSREVMVRNRRGGVSLQVEGGPLLAPGEPASVKIQASQVADIVVTHNGKEIGKVTGGSGEITVDSNQLGSGPIVLNAHSLGNPNFRARPLKFEFR